MTALVLLLFGTIWLSPARPVGPDAGDRPSALRLGMGVDEVRTLLGAPTHVSRQTVLMRCLEQWHYGRPHHLDLEFLYRRGQSPTLTAVRRAPAGTP